MERGEGLAENARGLLKTNKNERRRKTNKLIAETVEGASCGGGYSETTILLKRSTRL